MRTQAGSFLYTNTHRMTMRCSLYKSSVTKSLAAHVLRYVPKISMSITEPGKNLLEQKFLQDGESVEQRLALACAAFSTSESHAIRLAEYISRGWFMFATPLLANGGTDRGLPISCFLNYVPDSLKGLADHYTENIFLSTSGGGIGAHWSDVRSAGSPTSRGSEASGVVACLKVADSQVPAFRQGRTRQGAYAANLRIDHPEILEFLKVRSSDGGAVGRKSYNIHNCVCITDEFMGAVMAGKSYDLRDPHTGNAVGSLDARAVWGEILKLRMSDRGEPYLFFVDHANRHSPYEDPQAIKGTNLCTEITLQTTEFETAVCCLSSVNVEHFDEWSKNGSFIHDLVEMLDNALDVFMRKAPIQLRKAVHSALKERSIGLGIMGMHTYLQSKYRNIGSYSDRQVTEHIHGKAVNSSELLGRVRGLPVRCEKLKVPRRNLHLIAIAPNASSSIMLGCSPGIEPYRSNIYTVVQGSLMFEFKNPQLDSLFKIHTPETYEEVWQSIREHGGSVQHLGFLIQETKELYRTADEIDQRELVMAARQRQQWVCQAQSLNLFFKVDADPQYVNETHLLAWNPDADGVPLKSLYYLRPVVVSKVEHSGTAATRESVLEPTEPQPGASCSLDNKDDCLACQG